MDHANTGSMNLKVIGLTRRRKGMCEKSILTERVMREENDPNDASFLSICALVSGKSLASCGLNSDAAAFNTLL
jgi:hypothetical protein